MNVNGIINLIKPPGISSAQAVSFVKQLTGQKCGHAGTLDPEACGVLPIMVGKATSLFDYIVQEEKVYVAEVAFGQATDTQDAVGHVVAVGINYPSTADVQRILPAFVGHIMQRPPAFSAIKRDGKRLYQLARQGVSAEVEPRPIQIAAIDLLAQTQRQGCLIRVSCGKGTYIRTLCHDMGVMLGCPAHMRMLIRERSGPFGIDQGITMEELEQAVTQDALPGPWLLTAADTLKHLPRLTAPHACWKPCVNGVALPVDDVPEAAALPEGALATLYCRDALIGIYQRSGERLRVRVMLWEPQQPTQANS